MSKTTVINDSLRNTTVNNEEVTHSVDDCTDLDKLRFYYEYGYSVDRINRENGFSRRERYISVLEERRDGYIYNAKKDEEYINFRPFWIKLLNEQITSKTNDLQSVRNQYKRTRDFFQKNAWRFADSVKGCPDWFGQKVVEDDLEHFVGEGTQIKEAVIYLTAKRDQILNEVQWDNQFGILNVGYFNMLAKKVNDHIVGLKDNLDYETSRFDQFLMDDEEEFFVMPQREKKEYPTHDWTDEQLVMLISTSEDGRGVFQAEKILNYRREEELSRRQKKLSKTKVTKMADVIHLANLAAQTRNMAYKVESHSIKEENNEEKRRLRRLVTETRNVCVAKDRCWYNSRGRETKNPDEVTYGYTDIQFVPINMKYEASRNMAFSAMLGSIPSMQNVEEQLDCHFGNFDYQDYIELMKN